jgi:glucose dehydrogenase
LAVASVIAVVLITAVAASGGRSERSAATVPAFTAAQLSAPAGANWIASGGNVLGQRYSTLAQINPSNGGSLKLAWSTTLHNPTQPEKRGQSSAHPVIWNGVLYQQDAYGRLFALNGANGAILWEFDPQLDSQPFSAPSTHGAVAIGDGKVYYGISGVMYGIDAQNGKQVWANQIADPILTAQGFSGGPLYYDGKVFAGTTGGDSGANCIDFALDAKTGKVLWHYNNIPSNPSQQGWNTWPKEGRIFAGGAVWDPPSIDPKLGLVYFGISNAIPWSGALTGPGKELNSESVLALHVDTGKFAWVYQEIHHDIWDMDSNTTPMITTRTIKGKPTDVLVHMNKSTYNFILNAATGKPIIPAPETPVPQDPTQHTYPTQPIPVGDDIIPHLPNQPEIWQGLAPDGKPFILPTKVYTPYNDQQYTVWSPYFGSGADWYQQSISQKTGYQYACVNISEFAYKALPPADTHNVKFNYPVINGIQTYVPPTMQYTGRLVAIDISTNKIVWKRDTLNLQCISPVITTASGLVVIGRTNGAIEAYNDTTGDLAWTLPNVANTIPRLSTYSVGGKQYLVAFTNRTAPGTEPEIDAYTLP